MLVLAVAVAGIAAAAAGRDWSVLRVGALPRVVTWLAGLSYGIYLVNQQIGYFVAWGLEARFGVHGWPRLVLVVAVAVVLGWALTVLVERPVHRWLVRRPPQRGNEPAAARKRSTSSDGPGADPHAVARERAHDHLVLQRVLGELGRPVTQREPDEVGLRRRHLVPERAQLRGHPLDLGDRARAVGEQLVEVRRARRAPRPAPARTPRTAPRPRAAAAASSGGATA